MHFFTDEENAIREAYAVNGGAAGTDFLARLMSLQWVSGLRFVVLHIFWVILSIFGVMAAAIFPVTFFSEGTTWVQSVDSPVVDFALLLALVFCWFIAGRRAAAVARLNTDVRYRRQSLRRISHRRTIPCP